MCYVTESSQPREVGIVDTGWVWVAWCPFSFLLVAAPQFHLGAFLSGFSCAQNCQAGCQPSQPSLAKKVSM